MTTPKTSRECTCNCGQLTSGGLYRPGHDARHVSRLFQQILRYDDNWDRQQAVGRAMSALPSWSLQSKLRERLYKSADKHLGASIDRVAYMFKRGLPIHHLDQAILRIDPELAKTPSWEYYGVEVKATYAVAYGIEHRQIEMSAS